MTTGPMTTRTARMPDLDDVTELCMHAFADEAVVAWVAPDPATRRVHVRRMFGDSLGAAVETGSVIVAQAPDGEMVGASIWLPNTAGRHSTAPEAAGTEAAGSDSRDDPSETEDDGADNEADDIAARRLGLLDAAASAHVPRDPHLHLSSMATLPMYRGRGAGRAMLLAGFTWASRLQLPVYLEASTAENRRLYARLGFRDAGARIALPEDGPSLQPMWLDDARDVVAERA